MTNGQAGFLVLLFLALVLVCVGLNGSLGVLVGIFFCPRYVQLDE